LRQALNEVDDREPNPISAAAVRTHDMRARRSVAYASEKWLPAVTLTSNLPGSSVIEPFRFGHADWRRVDLVRGHVRAALPRGCPCASSGDVSSHDLAARSDSRDRHDGIESQHVARRLP